MQPLTELSRRVIAETPRLSGKQIIVEKELLHFDILRCLDSAGYLNGLTFVGGTALRLCHGSQRFSEDLDFDGGEQFSSDLMPGLESDLRSSLNERYGHEVLIKPPKSRNAAGRPTVATWRISVVTRPESPDFPRQRIHLDIANMPARSSRSSPVRNHYGILSEDRSPLNLQVKTMESILADKLVAFASTAFHRFPRWRDLWDINWLVEAGAQLRTDLVEMRANDFGINDIAPQIAGAAGSIPVLINSPAFGEQLSRFVDNGTAARTVSNSAWRQKAADSLQSLFGSCLAPHGIAGTGAKIQRDFGSRSDSLAPGRHLDDDESLDWERLPDDPSGGPAPD